MLLYELKMIRMDCEMSGSELFNPFNASCSKLLLFEGFSAILV